MLELGVIDTVESDYTSPLIFVEVSGQEFRPFIGHRKVNSVTRDQTYLIPNTE